MLAELKKAQHQQDFLTTLFLLRELQHSTSNPEITTAIDQLSVRFSLPQGTWHDRLLFELEHNEAVSKEIKTRWEQLSTFHKWSPNLLQSVLLNQSFEQEFYSATTYLEAPRVTLCLMAKNADDSLWKSLLSVEGLVDHYVLADTGSTDNTILRMQQWKSRQEQALAKTRVSLLSFEWCEHFADARNQLLTYLEKDALAKAPHWILILDADEILCQNAIKPLRDLLHYLPRREQVFAFQCEEYWVERLFPWQHQCLDKTWRRSELCFWGALHERLSYRRRVEKVPVHCVDRIALAHSGYTYSAYLKHRKAQRFYILEKWINACAQENPYALFHYAYALHYQCRESQKALRILKKSFELSHFYQHRPPRTGWFATPLKEGRKLMQTLLCQKASE